MGKHVENLSDRCFAGAVMTSKERFLKIIDREAVDRPCTWLGMPDPRAFPGLFKHFGVGSMPELMGVLDDDIWPVELPYHSPTSNAIYMAFDFTGGETLHTNEERTLNTPGCFADCDDLGEVERFPWPDPVKYIDPAECRKSVAHVPVDKVCLGVIWSAHFQDACAAFGMENALMTLLEEPEIFEAVNERITEFYLQANAIFFEATRGKLDAVLIGNDYGSQQALMLSPELINQYSFPCTKKLIDQAKGYGLKVIHHSCGAIRPIIGDLIELGVDVIHPIQAKAAGMEAASLKAEFGDRVAFCGGVDAQDLMVNGTPKEVAREVHRLRKIFPTGLIISPSHEAILPDTPPANVAALFRAARD
jgi:uroporphyrinogen decarboxylase